MNNNATLKGLYFEVSTDSIALCGTGESTGYLYNMAKRCSVNCTSEERKALMKDISYNVQPADYIPVDSIPVVIL